MTNDHRNYRSAFMLTLLLNLVLLAILGFWWWKSRSHTAENHPVSLVQGSSSQESTSVNAPSASDAPLAPLQLTPQRMQSIGVKLGMAQLKQVESELRVTGTVEADERRIAYVQTRFPGWIRNVYADASYQYIRKGQPLFTIYSPDLSPRSRNICWPRKNAEVVQYQQRERRGNRSAKPACRYPRAAGTMGSPCQRDSETGIHGKGDY